MLKTIATYASIILCFTKLSAQIVSVTPAFPTIDDVVTIVYDASEGNAALNGTSPIYAHTGVITTTSTSPTNWLYTKGTWGTADASVLMTSLGNNLHSITFDMDVFYNFPLGTVVTDMAFVFRNASGSIVGRSQDGTDIYYPVFPNNGELFAEIFSPNTSSLVDLTQQVSIHGESNMNASLSLFEDGILINQQNNVSVIDFDITATTEGTHLVELVADNGSFIKRDTVYYTVNPAITVLEPPVGLKNGINYLSDTSLILKLYAPDKQHIYVIGDFNNWLPSVNYHMNRSADNATWWIEITNLVANQKYGFQYFIDGTLKLADPLSTLVLDQNNDNSISQALYPNRLPYPTGKTTGFVTVIQPGATPFTWQNDAFTAIPKKDLIIYELLVRDFVSSHSYQTLIDTLDYLDRLGINAIELMPVGEFEGNESWGYNPSFHMSLDKYYGTPEKFKLFIDACHERGIAVIMDIALNHTFGQNPMVNMYWDAANNRPAANNPWFNAICPHEPYCWGYDLNHEVQATKDYIDRINSYWLEEFHIDGFRFDYTKGFVNNGNGYSDVRINNLKRMADVIRTVKSDAYIILEHWCDNAEEEQLSDYGMMLWANINYNYRQGHMGFTGNSNLSSGIHTNRGWTDPHLISYAESHDEERLMFESLTYGNTTQAAHNVRDLNVGLARAEATAVILLTAPGPKMLWQFQELGYDISIDNPCRVCNKPILWSYLQNQNRKKLYDIYAATLNLRKTNETFRTLDFSYSLSAPVKRFLLNNSTMDAVVLANFAVTLQQAAPAFQNTGWWYEYFSGDSINVTNVNSTIPLNAGEYRIYTTSRLEKPTISQSNAGIEDLVKEEFEINLFPVPSIDEINLNFISEKNQKLDYLILNQKGEVVREIKNQATIEGKNEFKLSISNLPAGNYHILVKSDTGFSNKEFVKL